MSAATPTPVRSRRRDPRARLGAVSDITGGGPHRPAGLVRRPALVERLTAADDASVAVLVAPPGYGKTSLLHEWSERDERPFVWLNAAALRSRGELRAVSRAIEAHAAPDAGLVLAVDDAHLVHPLILRQLVDAVATELPAHSTVAMASRTDPELPLGRLRAHRELIEMREAELALTAPEVAGLLRAGGLELDPDAADTIARRTEGWPVGVYLALLSLSAGGDPIERAREFCGTDHLVAEYFRDEVMSGIAPAQRQFMLRSSVLAELSGPACDAVLEREGSAPLLGELARTNCFLRAADAAHERFRWHAMFREALQAELRRVEPGIIPRLHQRASTWLYDRGDVDGAIAHAVSGGDVRRSGDLLTRHIVDYVGRGRTERVQRWLSGFPEGRVGADPRLALVAGHAALAQGDAAQAQRWRLIAGEADAACATPGDAPSRGPAAILLEGTSPRAEVATIERCAADAYELEGEGGQWRPLACLLRGVALHLRGERAAATGFLDEGMLEGRDIAPSVAAICCAQRATIAIELRDWDTASELTDRAIAELYEQGLADQAVCALVFAAAAAARARAGRSDEAKRDLRHGVDLLTELGEFLPWYGAEARILLAHASLGLADVVGARTLLAEASRYARRCPDVLIFQSRFDAAWAHIDTLAETSLSGPSSLTIAELRILRFLPSHRSFKEIAVQLGVSANTVKTQAHAVYRKLGAASRSEAVTRASQAGLLGQ